MVALPGRHDCAQVVVPAEPVAPMTRMDRPALAREVVLDASGGGPCALGGRADLREARGHPHVLQQRLYISGARLAVELSLHGGGDLARETFENFGDGLFHR